jgi:hypothetical protein
LQLSAAIVTRLGEVQHDAQLAVHPNPVSGGETSVGYVEFVDVPLVVTAARVDAELGRSHEAHVEAPRGAVGQLRVVHQQPRGPVLLVEEADLGAAGDVVTAGVGGLVGAVHQHLGVTRIELVGVCEDRVADAGRYRGRKDLKIGLASDSAAL